MSREADAERMGATLSSPHPQVPETSDKRPLSLVTFAERGGDAAAEAHLLTCSDLGEKAQEYLKHASAANTQRAYRSDWSHFEQWCHEQGVTALPALPEVLALYLTHLADTRKASTIQRRLTAISAAHRLAGHDVSPASHPLVRKVLQGIRRTKGVAPDRKAPALTAEVRLMVEALPSTVRGSRDAALLLVTFGGALRRSEAVAVDVEHLKFTNHGLIVHLPRSKADQIAAGADVGVTYGSHPSTCPVRRLREWLEKAEITTGPVFHRVTRGDRVLDHRLTAQSVALIIKRAAERVGLDPAVFSGHSLRSGLATSAAIAGAPLHSLRSHLRHRDDRQLQAYVRVADLFTQNASAYAGL